MIGSVINVGVLVIGIVLIPPPEGADISTPEGIRASMSRLTSVHFIAPLVAHQLGTLSGALVTALVAEVRKLPLALVIGGFFLAGGVSMALMVGGPAWFILCDLLFAYLPMAWLGGTIGVKLSTDPLRG